MAADNKTTQQLDDSIEYDNGLPVSIKIVDTYTVSLNPYNYQGFKNFKLTSESEKMNYSFYANNNDYTNQVIIMDEGTGYKIETISRITRLTDYAENFKPNWNGEYFIDPEYVNDIPEGAWREFFLQA